LSSNHRLIFGKNVNCLRQLRGITQEKLAELADVDRRHIQRIESGVANPGIEVIGKIQIALSLAWKELMEGRKKLLFQLARHPREEALTQCAVPSA
jgi:transcriptional regulator with XRE-family HTH domain